MNREEILNRINTTLKSVFDDKALVITEKTTANDIGDWDSLNHLTVISNVERTFGVKFSLSEITKLQNVGSMVDLIIAKSH